MKARRFAAIAVIFLAVGTIAAWAIPNGRAAQPSPRAHPRILLVGDSVLDQHGNAAAVVLRQHGFDVQVHGAWGTGLFTREQYDYGHTVTAAPPANSNQFDWLTKGQQFVDSFRPDLVVVYLNHNYWPPVHSDAQGNLIEDLRSPAGREMIETQVRAFIGIMRSHGARVAFEAPIPGDKSDPSADNPIWAAYLPVLQAAHVEIINTRAVVAAPDGTRTETMPDCTGAQTDVRPKGDIHLTRYGAGRVGTTLAATIAQDFGRSTYGDVAPGDHVATLIPTPSGKGYWIVGCDGGVYNLGDAPVVDGAGIPAGTKVIGAATATHGLWLVTNDGRIRAHGNAPAIHFATTPGAPLVATIGTRDHAGIIAVTATGHVVTAGSAVSAGEAAGLHSPVIALVAHPSGNGYWMLTLDGTVLGFGHARALGIPTVTTLAPIVGMASTQSGHGYWIVQSNGHVQAFGDAVTRGDAPHPEPKPGTVAQIAPNEPTIGITAAPGGGYWITDDNGVVHGFGGASTKVGDTGNLALLTP